MFTKISTAGLYKDEWRILRQGGIGGSEAGAVCGVNPYMSPLDVYKNKTEELPEEEDEKEAVRVGHDLEEYVAKRFSEATGLKVRKSNYMFQSVEHPFMIADVDRLIVGEDAGLECKTVNAYGESNWKDGKIPLHYLMQCYHYMAVTGKRIWYIAALIMGRAFVYYRIEWDGEVISRLIDIERKFWSENVSKRVLPDPDGTAAYTKALNEHFKYSANDTVLELSEELQEMLFKRAELIGQIDSLAEEKEKIEQQIKLAMGTVETARTGYHKISWKTVESRRINSSKLKKERPDIYDKYSSVSVTRRFEVKELEDKNYDKGKGDGDNGRSEKNDQAA
ncbi:MAG: YqaJ viral recombinase family protein [Lachnospiraceae bacterium]|nr:YqaJ viral recombinase family protein [Lachnospiraceae bacterium]